MSKAGRPVKGAELSTPVIVEQALVLLDRGGASALSFRALGRELGVTAMAITHHVGSRKEMLAVMVEHVYADVNDVPTTVEPIAQLRARLQRYCEAVVKHPHLAHCVLSDVSLMSDAQRSLTEMVRRTISTLGVPPPQEETLVDVLIDYTHGFAMAAASPQVHEGTALRPSLKGYLRGLDWILRAI